MKISNFHISSHLKNKCHAHISPSCTLPVITYVACTIASTFFLSQKAPCFYICSFPFDNYILLTHFSASSPNQTIQIRTKLRFFTPIYSLSPSFNLQNSPEKNMSKWFTKRASNLHYFLLFAVYIWNGLFHSTVVQEWNWFLLQLPSAFSLSSQKIDNIGVHLSIG